jgi:hypothetical protein
MFDPLIIHRHSSFHNKKSEENRAVINSFFPSLESDRAFTSINLVKSCILKFYNAMKKLLMT